MEDSTRNITVPEECKKLSMVNNEENFQQLTFKVYALGILDGVHDSQTSLLRERLLLIQDLSSMDTRELLFVIFPVVQELLESTVCMSVWKEICKNVIAMDNTFDNKVIDHKVCSLIDIDCSECHSVVLFTGSRYIDCSYMGKPSANEESGRFLY